MIFEPITIGGVTFKNRILRSSIGGKTAYYSGIVSPAWKHFEKRFAEGGVGGIVSATLSVHEQRWAPIEYPKISNDATIGPLREAIAEIQGLGVRYIIQIGDPGAHTQMSLFSEAVDGRSSSRHLDLLYGYRSVAEAMSTDEMSGAIENFAQGARRVRDAGADGVEITASKGYLIHQFLNPGINRRRDGYGGSPDNRFRFLREVMEAVRGAVGEDFLVGVRISAVDRNSLPVNLRLPVTIPFRQWAHGNGLPEMLGYAEQLEKLGAGYLHISAGYGFINPSESPGAYPYEEIRMFANFTRHLSGKAWARAFLLNMLPTAIGRPLLGMGWTVPAGFTASYAAEFKKRVSIPVVANGGFQSRSLIQSVLDVGSCDMVSMARALLANPDLLKRFAAGEEGAPKPCTLCNRCAVRTAIFPIGCYEPKRFASQEEIERQILSWSGGPPPDTGPDAAPALIGTNVRAAEPAPSPPETVAD